MSRPPPSRVALHDASGRDRHVLPSSEDRRTLECHGHVMHSSRTLDIGCRRPSAHGSSF